MIQGAVKAGQLPEPQVVLPGDLVEILIAHDMVRLGLAHYRNRGRVHSRALGHAVGERPSRPGGASGHDQPPQQQKAKKSPDH